MFLMAYRRKFDNFRLVKIKNICRQQLAKAKMTKLVLGTIDNIVVKKRQCCLPVLSPFPALFSKGLLGLLKTGDYVLKVLIVCVTGGEKISGSTRIRTQGLWNTVPALYHRATKNLNTLNPQIALKS